MWATALSPLRGFIRVARLRSSPQSIVDALLAARCTVKLRVQGLAALYLLWRFTSTVALVPMLVATLSEQRSARRVIVWRVELYALDFVNHGCVWCMAPEPLSCSRRAGPPKFAE